MTRQFHIGCTLFASLLLACGDASRTDPPPTEPLVEPTEPAGAPTNWTTGARPAGVDAGLALGESMGSPSSAEAADFGGMSGGGVSGGGVSGDVSGGAGVAALPYHELPSPPMQPRGGILTAGSFDDHLNPEVFDRFADSAGQRSQLQGWPNVRRRALISVRSVAGKPVPDALVQVKSGEAVLFESATGSDGRALFVPALDGGGESKYTLAVQAGRAHAEQNVALDTAPWVVTLDHTSALPKTLDLAFVVDATGSMGDELEFLKAETASIAQQVSERFPEVDINYGLIVYRDDGDEYVTRGFGFTDLQTFGTQLAQQSANGGGDYPEAMHTALQEAVEKFQWRPGNVVRMAFLLADAPPHDDKIEATFGAIQALREKNVRLYPVAASGVAELAEQVMRLGAFLTLGRYLWLTDDSGVGNPHAEPKVPCYDVEMLQKLMIRMISSELAGELLATEQADILRSVGSSVGGICQPAQ